MNWMPDFSAAFPSTGDPGAWIQGRRRATPAEDAQLDELRLVDDGHELTGLHGTAFHIVHPKRPRGPVPLDDPSFYPPGRVLPAQPRTTELKRKSPGLFLGYGTLLRYIRILGNKDLEWMRAGMGLPETKISIALAASNLVTNLLVSIGQAAAASAALGLHVPGHNTQAQVAKMRRLPQEPSSLNSLIAKLAAMFMAAAMHSESTKVAKDDGTGWAKGPDSELSVLALLSRFQSCTASWKDLLNGLALQPPHKASAASAAKAQEIEGMLRP